MADIDLSWAHPSLAKHARRIFKNIREDGEGRLNVADVKSRFHHHGRPMLGEIERIGGREWAYLADNWQSVLKDWAMCAGVSPYCPKEG